MNREKYLFSLRLHDLAWIDRYLHIFSKKKGNYFLFSQFFWWWLYSIMERAGGGENGKQGNCYTPHQGNRGTMVSFSPSTLQKESKRLESFIGWLTPTKGRERPHDWPYWPYIESYPSTSTSILILINTFRIKTRIIKITTIRKIKRIKLQVWQKIQNKYYMKILVYLCII